MENVEFSHREHVSIPLCRSWVGSCMKYKYLESLFRHTNCQQVYVKSLYEFAALAGSSMLKALGMDIQPVAAVGFSAGIKWVIKDGIGALGRFFVGGRLGEAFDEDPKRWRMIAEGISTLGLALEIATQIYPSHFVLLAGSGTLARATGKGIGRPCFRVVQTHFGADHNNVGAVAAKEEVWEVTAQLIGLGASVGVLSVLDGTGNPGIIIPVWVVVHGIHVGIRYLALKKLRFPWLNYKRAVSVLISHVKTRVVPSIDFVNENETILGGMKSMEFSCKFGCSLIEALEVTSIIQDEARLEHEFARNGKLLQLITIYKNEKYILVWGSSTTAYIILREGAGPREMLRAAWQAAWLYDENTREDGEDAEPHRNWCTYVELLERSVNEMQTSFTDMWEKATNEGWELERTVLPVGPYRLQEVDSLDPSNRENYSHDNSDGND